MNTVIKKMFRDVRIFKGRTLLTLCGILIGITAVGSVISAYAILDREMKKNFMDTNPSSVVLNVSNLDEKAVNLINQKYSNIDAELRKTVIARISREDGTFGTIHVTAVQDFNKLKLDTFTLEKGQFPASSNEMAIERDSLKILKNVKTGVNENVQILLPGGKEGTIRLSGKVHAPGLAPASMENYSYGFVKLEMLKDLGYKGWFDEIHLVNYDNRLDWNEMKVFSRDIKKLLSDNGYIVNTIEVPEPGMHPHHDQLQSLIFLLQAFTIVALIAACLIIINLLNFIMSRQKKQIAIMKALGASRKNIALPYFVYVLIISAGALIVSIPFAMLIGNGYSSFAAGILNFKISSYSVPYWVFLIQAIVGIAIPIVSSAYPIYKTCSISVRDGLSEKADVGLSIKTKLFSNMKNLKIVMPVNNLLRKRTRTILAVLALTTGGILFMTSLNIIASINKTVDQSSKDLSWDYSISLSGKYPEETLKNTISSVKGLKNYEIWNGSIGTFKKKDGTSSAYYTIKIIPEGTNMLGYLKNTNIKSNENKIIINNALADEEEWIKQGAAASLSVNGKSQAFEIDSIVNELPPFPAIYIYQSTYEKLFGMPMKQMVIASADTMDVALQRQITKDIEKAFEKSAISISENLNVYALRKAFADHLTIVVTFLLAVSLLAVVVGGLSISSAVGISISERKREIGVMRAVGVNINQITRMALIEVSLMGIAGWLLGVLVSYPISILLGNYFGQIFLHTGLQNTLSLQGIVYWFAVSVGVSLLAGLFPSRKASGSPLHDLLSYE